MKKFLALALILVMARSLTACGGTFLEDEVQYANAVAGQAVTCMEAVIQTRPGGVALICANNEGCANTIFLGFDGSTGACQVILDGQLTMSIARQPCEMGYLACQAAYETLQGNAADACTDSPIEGITPENAQARIDAVNAHLGK